MPPYRVRQLYNTIAVPAFTYAVDVWYMGIREGSKGAHQMGSLAVTKKIGAHQCRPNYWPAFTTHIASSKEEALKAICLTHDHTSTAIYCDGSGYKGSIGASAVLYVDNEERSSLRYFLGSATKHTVYKAEIVGMTLGLHLLHGFSKQLRGLTAIGTDSQALIRALRNQCPHPTHYLLDAVHNAAENLHRKQDRLHTAPNRCFVHGTNNVWKPHSCGVICLQVHWSPGHMDFAPNERADVLAKEAACGLSSPPSSLPTYLQTKPLPLSIPATWQTDLTVTQVLWKRRWKKSPCYRLIHQLDRTLPSRSYMRLTSSLDCHQSAMLMQFRMGHLPLNLHLFRIRHAESPVCPHCRGLTVESVQHFILECPQYHYERHIHLVQPLKRRAESLTYLFSTPNAIKHLLRYTEATKRFKLAPDVQPPQPQHP
ncbi:hypothetical protein J132_08289 [Termitomyces sp. J132]|nr:hypothetical protein J132_08289 [Termitomyces sp. J132]